MALINCPECQKSVSDTATSCPGCGAPIASKAETQAAGVQITTTQETSKKLKTHSVLAIAMLVIGALFTFTGGNANGENEFAGIGAVFLGVGLVWWLVTKIRVWWHHK